MAFKVVCVDKDSGSRYNDCRCIETIGYEVLDSVFKRTPEQIHEKIEEDDREFYILENGERTYLEAKERLGTKYVRTKPNDTEEDNLLSQEGCARY